jgi:hypothetical protein
VLHKALLKNEIARRLARYVHININRSASGLLQGAADAGEYVVGVRTNEADRAHDDYQNHGEHHCVFGNILTTLIVPKFLPKFCHGLRLLKNLFSARLPSPQRGNNPNVVTGSVFRPEAVLEEIISGGA